MASGSVQLMPVKRNKNRSRQPREVITWKDTLAASAVNNQDLLVGTSTFWYQGKVVISKANDKCKVGAWVFAQLPFSVSVKSTQSIMHHTKS